MQKEKSNEKKSLPASIVVDDFVVNKLCLGQYIIVLEKVRNIFDSLSGFESIDEKTVLNNIGLILSKALPDVAEVLSIATGETKQAILEVDGLTAIKLIKAFFQVNDFFLMIEEIKTIMPKNQS